MPQRREASESPDEKKIKAKRRKSVIHTIADEDSEIFQDPVHTAMCHPSSPILECLREPKDPLEDYDVNFALAKSKPDAIDKKQHPSSPSLSKVAITHRTRISNSQSRPVSLVPSSSNKLKRPVEPLSPLRLTSSFCHDDDLDHMLCHLDTDFKIPIAKQKSDIKNTIDMDNDLFTDPYEGIEDPSPDLGLQVTKKRDLMTDDLVSEDLFKGLDQPSEQSQAISSCAVTHYLELSPVLEAKEEPPKTASPKGNQIAEPTFDHELDFSLVSDSVLLDMAIEETAGSTKLIEPEPRLEPNPDTSLHMITSTASQTPFIKASKKRRMVITDASSSVTRSDSKRVDLPEFVDFAQPFPATKKVSPFQDAQFLKRNTPLIERRQRRQNRKRKEPMVRGTPLMIPNVHLEKQADISRAKKQKKKPMDPSNPFFDVEASLSEGSSASSDEEGDDLDQDLSGFIVNSMSSQVEQPTQNYDQQVFYRKSLLSPEFGGLGRKREGFRFRTPDRPGLEVQDTQMPLYQDSDTPGSLNDFIVDDTCDQSRTRSDPTGDPMGELDDLLDFESD